MIETPKVLYKHKEQAGNPFQPSNGTEGMMFMDAFCCNCKHGMPDGFCEITLLSMGYSITDKEYPKEMIFNEEGWPVCTKYEPPEAL